MPWEVAEGSNILVPSCAGDACFLPRQKQSTQTEEKIPGKSSSLSTVLHDFFFFFFSVTLTNILILQIKLKLLNDAFYLKDVSFPLMLLACSSQVWISKMFFSFPTMKWWRSRVTWCLCVCKVVCECMTERKNRAGRKKKQGNPEWEQNQIWKEIQFSNDISIIFNQI